ncbi:MAG: ATP-binding cassette domain-containing protein [Bryobacteraceae bacterium]|nr:ATP-binding cassette domain-containing protein [Bryobacteraceae bacterium]
MTSTSGNKVLECSHLTKIYGQGCGECVFLTGPSHVGSSCPRCGSIVALADVSLDLWEGEILGFIGESGSGKSTLLRLLSLEEPPTSGKALFFQGGRIARLFELDAAEKRKLRSSDFCLLHQNSCTALNHRLSAGGNIAERLLGSGCGNYREIRSRAAALLERMGVRSERMDQSPAGFSGGMQQRVQIAKALASNPTIAFLDELTGALDLSVQARILDLLLELQHELRMTMIVVTHDLGVVRLLAGRTMVLQSGRVVEAGLTDQILEDPQHPFTQELVVSAL